jgi:hypothetical protein
MTWAMVLAQVAARVSRELYRDFSVVPPEPVVAACVRDTLVDLHGSISTEALPEMAAALATVRLTEITPTRAATPGYGDRQHPGRAARRGRRPPGLRALPTGGRPMKRGHDDTPRYALPGLPDSAPAAGPAGDTQQRSRPGTRRSAPMRQPAPALRPGLPAAKAPPRRMPVHRAAPAIAPPGTRRAADASPHCGVLRRRCPGRRRARAGHRGAHRMSARPEPEVDNPGHRGMPSGRGATRIYYT